MNKRTISLFKKLQKLNLTHSFSIDHSLSDDQLKNLHGRLSMNSSAYRIMLYRSPETLEEFNDLVIKSTALGKVTNLEKYILMYGEELGTKKYGELNNLKSMTKENMIRKYGEKEGTIKWDAYRAKQAYTNSFEYKKEKYGMSKEDFDAFNLSRACTLENMIDRHGEKEGNIKWKAYCDRQSYTNGKEYLGDRYEEVNKKKGINLEYFIFKYGEELGHKKYIERLNKPSFYSKKSQVLFDLLINTDTFKDKKCYYATNIGEYGVYDKINKSYKMYDFVCPELNLCIEFNGDHFHGNPKIYESNDFLKAHGQTNTTAVEAWERDVQKNNLITNERGFAVVVVWENDWDNNQQFVIDRICEICKEK